MAHCTHDRCKILSLHEAHDEDFRGVGASTRGRLPTGRKLRTKAAILAAAGLPAIRRMHGEGPGQMAYVDCPECSAAGCGYCLETGQVSLFRWHLWNKNCCT